MIVRIVPIIPVVSNTGRSYGYTTRIIANDPDDWEDLDGLDRIEWTPLKSKKKNNNNTTAKMFAPKFKFSDLDRVWANGEIYHYKEANDHRCFLRFSRSLRASSPIWASETRSRVLARLASLAQIGELARRLILALMKLSAVGRNTTVE